jgi:hypothetical protein
MTVSERIDHLETAVQGIVVELAKLNDMFAGNGRVSVVVKKRRLIFSGSVSLKAGITGALPLGGGLAALVAKAMGAF